MMASGFAWDAGHSALCALLHLILMMSSWCRLRCLCGHTSGSWGRARLCTVPRSQLVCHEQMRNYPQGEPGGGGGWPFVPLEPALLSLRVNTGCPRVNFIDQEPQNHPIMYVSWGYWKICSKWGVFLLLSFESYMCSLYTQVLHQRHDLHIFLSQSEANYFILLVMPFTEQVWLLLIKSNLSLFFLIQILLLMSTLRTFCLALGPEDFLLCFL